MSPTEDQLRAALREGFDIGAGSGLDPDTVIGRAEEFRRQRRMRILATSATVIVVAGIGLGIGVATSSTGNDKQQTAAGSAASTHSGAGVANPAPQANLSIPSRIACPPAKPAVVAAATTSGSLFRSNVVTVTVCGYRYDDAQIPVSNSYSAADARTIVASLENASRDLRPQVQCTLVRSSGATWLAFLATYADGSRSSPVVAGVGCSQTVTNGVTTRFDWTPPTVLASLLAKMNVAH